MSKQDRIRSVADVTAKNLARIALEDGLAVTLEEAERRTFTIGNYVQLVQTPHGSFYGVRVDVKR